MVPLVVHLFFIPNLAASDHPLGFCICQVKSCCIEAGTGKIFRFAMLHAVLDMGLRQDLVPPAAAAAITHARYSVRTFLVKDLSGWEA